MFHITLTHLKCLMSDTAWLRRGIHYIGRVYNNDRPTTSLEQVRKDQIEHLDLTWRGGTCTFALSLIYQNLARDEVPIIRLSVPNQLEVACLPYLPGRWLFNLSSETWTSLTRVKLGLQQLVVERIGGILCSTDWEEGVLYQAIKRYQNWFDSYQSGWSCSIQYYMERAGEDVSGIMKKICPTWTIFVSRSFVWVCSLLWRSGPR